MKSCHLFFLVLLANGSAHAQQSIDNKSTINQNEYPVISNLQGVESSTLFPKDGVTPNIQNESRATEDKKTLDAQSIIPSSAGQSTLSGQTIFSNEVTSKQIGNQIIYSNGVVCTQVGSQLTCINE